MLEHSQQNYGPLPSELRPYRVRSRTSSRASPYPVQRTIKPTFSPERTRQSRISASFEDHFMLKPSAVPLLSCDQDISTTGSAPLSEAKRNINVLSPSPALETVKASGSLKTEKAPPVPLRPRVTSSARRTALGWSKRSTGKSASKEQKENISQGTMAT